MIVNRRMFTATKGCMDEAIAVLVAEGKRMGMDMSQVRVYRDLIAPFDQFGFEMEYENLAQYEQSENDDNPKISPEFWAKWNTLTLTGGTNEIWTVTGGSAAPRPRNKPMIVNRRVFIATKGRYDEAVATLADAAQRLGHPWSEARIYTGLITPFDQFAVETEFESLAQYEQVEKAPEPSGAAEFWAKWNVLTLTGGTNEMWSLVE